MVFLSTLLTFRSFVKMYKPFHYECFNVTGTLFPLGKAKDQVSIVMRRKSRSEKNVSQKNVSQKNVPREKPV